MSTQRKTYLQNGWYMAAWDDEVGDAMMTRRLLDIPVVMYRDAGGRVVALEDKCPHRFAKLSQGQRVGDDGVRCIYHGLEFDRSGACVANALPLPVPRAAKVRAFPIVEQDRIVWIWMGDAALADATAIPRFDYHVAAGRRMVKGLKYSKADYRLYCDNLMDLSHIVLLHPVFQAVGREMSPKSREEGDDVLNRYENFEPDQWLHTINEIRWSAPASLSLESHNIPDFGKGRDAIDFSANLITPETATTCHYFWSLSVEAGHKGTTAELQAMMQQVLDEDAWMVDGVQEVMGDAEIWDLNPILLGTDTAAIRVRRKLDAMMAAEAAASVKAAA